MTKNSLFHNRGKGDFAIIFWGQSGEEPVSIYIKQRNTLLRKRQINTGWYASRGLADEKKGALRAGAVGAPGRGSRPRGR